MMTKKDAFHYKVAILMCSWGTFMGAALRESYLFIMSITFFYFTLKVIELKLKYGGMEYVSKFNYHKQKRKSKHR